MRRTRIEHMSAGLPPITDIARRGWHGRKVPDPDMEVEHHLISPLTTQAVAVSERGPSGAPER